MALTAGRPTARVSKQSKCKQAITLGDGVVLIWQSMWRSVSSAVTIASSGSIRHEGLMVQLPALCVSLKFTINPTVRSAVGSGQWILEVQREVDIHA
jgi:H+/Cl- antiporter ClcA